MKKLFPCSITLAAVLCTSLLFSCTSNIELPPPPLNDEYSSSSPVGVSSSSSPVGVSSSSLGGSSGQQCLSVFDGNEFIDPRDCKAYKYEIASNGRVWMMENLNYSRNNTLGWCYKTGTGINTLGTAGEDLPGCDSPYGRHYTYAIAMDGTTGQGLCPDGWVIPSVAEWGAVSGMPSNFYVKAGNFHPDVSDPLLSGEWKERGTNGFYWVRNNPSGNSAGFAFVNGTSIEARSPGASNAAKTSDYFSVRCIMSLDYQPRCGGQPFDPATHGCVGGVVETKCGTSWYNATNTNLRCQSNVVETKCGTSWYDATNTNLRCQSDVVETKCGTSWYDATIKFCQSGTNAVKDLCGGTAAYTSTEYCKNGTTPTLYGSMTDNGGQTYKTVVIGDQTWMAENLNYNVTGSRCYGDNSGGDSQSNCAKYGRLYNWATAMANCPSGWHLPSHAEWNVLMKFVNPSCSDNSTCAGAGTKLKATSGWNAYSGVPSGSDTYGFSALPGGRGYSDGNFGSAGNGGYWWSASEYNSYDAYFRLIYYYSENVYYSIYAKCNLYSVRCLQD